MSTYERTCALEQLLERRNLRTEFDGKLYAYALAHIRRDGATMDTFARYARKYGEQKAIAYTLNEIQARFYKCYVKYLDR